MKIVSLNIYGGNYHEPLVDFLRLQASTVDVFCFQEVFHNDAGIVTSGKTRTNFFNELGSLLPGFEGHFAACAKRADLGSHSADQRIERGNAMFIKKGTEVSSVETVFVVGEYNIAIEVSEEKENLPVVLQKATVLYQGSPLVVAHTQGIPYPGNKLDAPSRLLQSKNIAQNLQGSTFVLIGDFNLLPKTESVALLEEIPARNLIKEYGILATRPQSHLLAFAPHDRQSFADYTFVSPQLKVKSFTVPEVEVSDHLPLIVELE